MSHVLYLHGFASSPKTAKGQALGRMLADRSTSYDVPELDGGDFSGLTIDGMRTRIAEAIARLPADGKAVVLLGSSLGGYLAASFAAGLPRVRGLCLIAPAFEFPSYWEKKLGSEGIDQWRRDGSRLFFHYSVEREVPLGWGFYASCVGLPDYPAPSGLPVAIVHGRQDETVDWRVSLRYADRSPGTELHVVDGDHRLTDPRHEELIAWCARDVLNRV